MRPALWHKGVVSNRERYIDQAGLSAVQVLCQSEVTGDFSAAFRSLTMCLGTFKYVASIHSSLQMTTGVLSVGLHNVYGRDYGFSMM